MKSLAYWLGPAGEHRELRFQAHIEDVIAHPEVFGVTGDWLREIYDRHGEPMGLEGEARLEIILALLARGWIRIRSRQSRWDVSCFALDPTCRTRLTDWAAATLRSGVDPDPHKPVIVSVTGGTNPETVDLGTIRSLGAQPPG